MYVYYNEDVFGLTKNVVYSYIVDWTPIFNVYTCACKFILNGITISYTYIMFNTLYLLSLSAVVH